MRDDNEIEAVTDLDLQVISGQLLHLLVAAPRALYSIGQCYVIARSDGVDKIVQEADPELYGT